MDAAEPLELTILMPCLNEAETVATCVRKAMEWLIRAKIRGEVVVADNGSVDGSQRLAAEAGARIVPVPRRGYGAALLEGIANARGTYVIIGDSDDSYDFSDLGGFIEELRKGYDLVMGNRFAGGVAAGAMPALHYYLGNPVLSFIGRVFFKSPCSDFHCGLRGFRRDAINQLNLQTTGMEFASEMVVKATLAKYRITEVPTTLKCAGRTRPPHLRSWRDGWRHLRFLLMYSPRWLFLYPGLLLMLLGLVVAIRLEFGPIYIRSVTLDIHTLLACASLLIIGYQAVIFAVFTKTFAMTEGLLPPDPRFERLFGIVNLEIGLAVGALQLVLGVGGGLLAVELWHKVEFGNLAPSVTMRIFIPALVLCITGVLTILASFFMSILGLRRR